MILKQCDRDDPHAAHRWFDDAFRVWTCEGVSELTPAARIAEHRGDVDYMDESDTRSTSDMG